MGWVPEGQRSGRMSYSTSTRSASYATVGEEDSVTFEAVSAAQGFEDVQAVATMRLLQKMMLKEENAFLGGNGSLQLGAPAAPSLSVGGSGASLPTATYSVIVVALTYEGYRNSSVAAGVATSKSITGADGNSFTLNGGSSAPSANATQAVTLGQLLSASVTPIVGAVGLCLVCRRGGLREVAGGDDDQQRGLLRPAERRQPGGQRGDGRQLRQSGPRL